MKFIRSSTLVGSRILILQLMLLCIGIHFTGTSHAFICTNTNFVKDDLLCDGVNNCGDRSDEESCLNCTGNSFHCTWSLECILKENHCDRKRDCRDESDETSCPCSDEEFKCTNLDCIRLTNRCDGRKDCTDGSDEKNCSNCTPSAFYCAKIQECFPVGVDLANRPDCLETTVISPEILLDLNTTNNVNISIGYNKNNCTGNEFDCVNKRNCILKNSDAEHDPGCFENATTTGLEIWKIFIIAGLLGWILILMIILLLIKTLGLDSKYSYSFCMTNDWDLSKIFCPCCPSVKFVWAGELSKSCRPVWSIFPKTGSEILEDDTLLIANDSSTPMASSPNLVVENKILLQEKHKLLENEEDAAFSEFLKYFVISCYASSSDKRNKFISVLSFMRLRPLATLLPEKEKLLKFSQSLGTEIFLISRDDILAWKAACPENQTLIQDLGEYAEKACFKELVIARAEGLSEAKREEILNCFVKSHKEFKRSMWDKIFDKNYNVRLFFAGPRPPSLAPLLP